MTNDRKIYADMMSQPARALYIFCKSAGIDIEFVMVNIAKGEHWTSQYRAINPLGKIPCYAEPGFSLGESASIMRYLASTNKIADHWYPSDARHRARIDSAMDWHHNNIRRGSAGIVFNRIIAPRLGQQINSAAAEDAEKLLIEALKTLERFWLKSSSFMSGEEISIADLLIVTELDMLQMLAGTSEGMSREELLMPFTNVKSWMQRVAHACTPHHEHASRILVKASAAAKKRLKASQSKL